MLPLPQPNNTHILRRWHQSRCAICGVFRPDPVLQRRDEDERRPVSVGLFEDHDHSTGNTRGYLCPRCNTVEGRSKAPIFDRYRQRPPASILGIRGRWRCWEHPDDRAARNVFELALDGLQHRADLIRRHPRITEDRLPSVTPLMATLDRVDLTWAEWFGVNPEIHRRWRFRHGIEPTNDEYAAYYRDSLTEWVRERAAER